MICVFMYAIKAVADVLLSVSGHIGKMAGILAVISSIMTLILYIPRLIRAVLPR